MTKKMTKDIRVLLKKRVAVFLILAATMSNVFSVYGAYSGSIKILLKDLKSSSSNRGQVDVEIFNVGRVNEKGEPLFDPQYEVSEYPQSSEALDKAAKKIEEKIKEEAVFEGKTDTTGIAAFYMEN